MRGIGLRTRCRVTILIDEVTESAESEARHPTSQIVNKNERNEFVDPGQYSEQTAK